jgi:CRP/FNR family transcriptional regulator, nitrogen fixation regulation protein
LVGGIVLSEPAMFQAYPSAGVLGREVRRKLPSSLHPIVNPAPAAAAVPRSFARNAAIYQQNDPADHLYEVVSGIVRTFKILLDGRRQIAAFYLPGDTFGVTPGEEHEFSAEAVIDTRILVSKSSILVSSQWGLVLRELQLAQAHFLLLVKTAPERVASFLLEMDDRMQADEVELPMPRRDIADYLGLTIETVSRTLTQLEKEAAIVLTTSKRIVLRDRAALQRLIA